MLKVMPGKNKPKRFNDITLGVLDIFQNIIGEIDMAEIEKQHGKNVCIFPGH